MTAGPEPRERALPAPDSAETIREAAEQHLRALAGPHARLRADQWTAIKALVVDRRRALVVQRTGWGKSAVYFVATALLRGRGAGPTVIVSPLLALMRNQIAAAQAAGIRARTINSANIEEWDEVHAEIEAGTVDVLLVSPERLNNPGFRDLILPKLAGTAGMLVIDEAHCISDWGHDFRPDYRRLRAVAAGLPPDVPVLATTATANARVTRDVAEQLGSRWHGPAEPAPALVLRGPLDRRSLRLAVVRLPAAPQRLAWLADRLGELPGSGIIYTLTVAAAHEVAEFLRDRGYPAEAYTGQTDPAQRLAVEDGLLANKLKAVVATSALGMGYDKPDLGFIVHLGAPPSPVAYYQQIGRAGRGVERAEVILLPATEDRDIWAYFASLAFPPERDVRATLATLAAAGGPQSLAALETHVDLPRTRLEAMLKVLDVDGAVRRVPGGWTATGEPWSYDKQRYDRVAAERFREQQAMLGYAETGGCRMEYLRRELDDPQAAPCGRCDNCTGVAREAGVSSRTEEFARDRLRRPGVTVTPRRLWPTGMAALGVEAAGKIPAAVAAEPGRSVGRLTDIGWGGTLRRVLAGPAPDGPVPDDLFGAVLKVLAAWEWAERPAGVVTLPSRTRPEMIAALGQRIASAGRLRYLGGLGYRNGAPPGQQYNSAQRLAALWRTLTVPGELSTALAGFGQPVLLVDDRIGTGWTMTVGAKLLREAGVPAVLPFALAMTA
jgi:ATP-dependent DNA helicase RecQ